MITYECTVRLSFISYLLKIPDLTTCKYWIIIIAMISFNFKEKFKNFEADVKSKIDKKSVSVINLTWFFRLIIYLTV